MSARAWRGRKPGQWSAELKAINRAARFEESPLMFKRQEYGRLNREIRRSLRESTR